MRNIEIFVYILYNITLKDSLPFKDIGNAAFCTVEYCETTKPFRIIV